MNNIMQPSPTVCTPNTKKLKKQMENDEFDGEINDKELVLELLKFSTIPLLYMTEYLQKDIEFYQKAVIIDGMGVAWKVSGICDKETKPDAIKNSKGSTFPLQMEKP